MSRILPIAFAVAVVSSLAACSSNPPPRYGYSSGAPYGYSSVPPSAVTVYPQPDRRPMGGNPYGNAYDPYEQNGTPYGADPRDTLQ